ncbi:MAG: hypothetical protein WD602_11230 [Actinomycetota bacterium]
MSDVFRLQPAGAEPEKPPRGRSTISFPYYDLRQSEKLAGQVRSNAGKCKPEQLAAWLGHRTLNSGAFRNRVSSASLFALVISSRNLITLTELGRRIVEPGQTRQARVEAFLSVPLYRRIFEDYKGRRLPPSILLQQQMVQLGVTPSQVQAARQVFMRSAEQAGFLEVSEDRLVEPRQPDFGDPAPAQKVSEPQPARYPALIEAVLQQAPWDREWTEVEFKDWSDLLIRAARLHFRLQY